MTQPPKRKRTCSSGPHDIMFKFGLADRRAAAELASFLPSPLAERLDFNTIEPEPCSFVNSNLRQLHADCMYRVKTKTNKDAYIVLLVEHQSQSDRWMPLRLLEYTTAVWKRLQRNKKKPITWLPYLFPVVLYSGQDPYSGPTTLREMIQFPEGIDPEEAATYGTSLKFFLITLANISDERLSATERLCLSLLPLKHIRDTLPLELIAEKAKKLPEPELKDYMVTLSNYIIDAREDTSPQDVERLEHYFQSFGVNTMTLGEKWRQEGLEKGIEKGLEKGREEGREEGINIGIEKGLEKGREEGHQDVARNMLKLGLDLNLIQKATGLALELLQKMRQNMNSSPQT